VSIAIDADEYGLALKQVLCGLLAERGVPFEDLAYLSSHQADYPDVALHLARQVQMGRFDRGILICGTGLGMAMVANKVRGVFAGPCHDVYSAERLRKSNDAQIIALGALVVGPELAKMIICAWLDAEFEGGRSQRKVERMRAIETETYDGAA
jgi:ribose 5-phosphate isomerase B